MKRARRLEQERGMSLVGALMGTTLIAAGALGLATLVSGVLETMNLNKVRNDVDALTEELRAHLSSPQACLNTFAGQSPLTNGKTGTITQIMNSETTSPTPHYQTGSVASSGAYTIREMSYSYRDVGAPANGGGEILLRVRATAAIKVQGPSDLKAREVIIATTKNPATNTLETCLSKARMTDGIWRRSIANLNDIFFATGRVGIGTSTPQQALHVNQDNAGQGYITFTDLGDAGGRISMGDGTATAARMAPTLIGEPRGADRSTNIISQIPAAEDTGIEASIELIGRVGATQPLANRPVVSFYNHLTQLGVILANGNVGFGTTNPQSALHVGRGVISVSNPAAPAGNVAQFHVEAADVGVVNYGHNGGPFGGRLDLRVENVPILSLLQGGNVGIGTTAPATRLHVAGDVRADGCVRASTGSLGGTCVSDARLKKDLRPFALGLEALRGLRPFTFSYNGRGGTSTEAGRELGLLAQDVERVAPELVVRETFKSKDESLELRKVNYTALPYLLLNALKELDEKVNALSAENAILKAHLCAKEPAAPFCRE